jgi:hypothetical protein
MVAAAFGSSSLGPPSCRLIAQAGCCVASHCAAVSSSRRPLTAPPSRRQIVQAGCCVASHCTFLRKGSRKICCRCQISQNGVTRTGPLSPNVTCGSRDDGSRCTPPPRTSNVVIRVGLAIASPLPLPSLWMLLLALQPCPCCHHSCRRCQCSFCCLPPSPTLVAITITITLFVAIAIARPPPLLPSPHPHHRSHRPCPPHPCPLRCLPALSPSPSPTSSPSPSPSPSPLSPSMACNPRFHRSCRQSHCSLRRTPLVDCFVFTFNVGWLVSQQVSQHAKI